MRKVLPLRALVFSMIGLTLAVLCLSPARAQTATAPSTSAEQRTVRYFDSIRKSPPQLNAFILRMPKGADLHSHLSGAVYAESYIQWAADANLCVNLKTMILTPPQPPSGCSRESDQLPASAALMNSVLYRQMIDAWSMRNWQHSGQSGHDHFFDTFVKFGAATYNQTGKMVAEVVSRAARGHVLYLELMLTPDAGGASSLGQTVGWDGDLEGMLAKLKSGGIDNVVATSKKNLEEAELEKDRLLKCGTPQADAGCSVVVRYIAQVSRNGQLGWVFAQMVNGMLLANDPNSKVVAINLVQPEDGLAAMRNFSIHMKMLSFLRPLYPRAHLTLHAGELVSGLVPPEGLGFHVSDSVKVAKADRIGHGVDIMYEDDPYGLLKEMARRNVMVEICLSSNESILGVSGSKHPLTTYMQYDVPVALATDDEGVSRSDISREFLKATEDQGLGYLPLKTMARNSLQYAFISGESLWGDGRKFTAVPQCSEDLVTMTLRSNECRQYLAGSAKATLQWQLEQEFNRFESQY